MWIHARFGYAGCGDIGPWLSERMRRFASTDIGPIKAYASISTR